MNCKCTTYQGNRMAHEVGCPVGEKARVAQQQINRVNSHVFNIAQKHDLLCKINVERIGAHFYDSVELPTEAEVAALFAQNHSELPDDFGV